MTINSTLNHDSKRDEVFPAFYVCKNNGNYVILVTERHGTSMVGTVITQGDWHQIGHHSKDWSVPCFERLNGSFTVTQD